MSDVVDQFNGVVRDPLLHQRRQTLEKARTQPNTVCACARSTAQQTTSALSPGRSLPAGSKLAAMCAATTDAMLSFPERRPLIIQASLILRAGGSRSATLWKKGHLGSSTSRV